MNTIRSNHLDTKITKERKNRIKYYCSTWFFVGALAVFLVEDFCEAFSAFVYQQSANVTQTMIRKLLIQFTTNKSWNFICHCKPTEEKSN